MKKTIGTILAVLCLTAALLLGSGTAFAQTAGQWTPREHPQDTIGCVNGAQSDEIIAQQIGTWAAANSPTAARGN